MSRCPSLSLFLVPLALAVACPAWADEVPFDNQYETEVLGIPGFDFDTDWIPGGSPIQVRLHAHLGTTLGATANGTAEYDWAFESIRFTALPDGGAMELDLGLTAGFDIRYEIGTFSGEDSILGLEWGIFEDLPFEPFLLDGHPERPVAWTTSLYDDRLVDFSAIDIGVASVDFVVDLAVGVALELYGTRIHVEPVSAGAGPGDSITVHRQWLQVSPPNHEDPFVVEAQLETELSVGFEISVFPAVIVDLLGTEYELLRFELPVDFEAYDEIWAFEPQALTFTPPPAPKDPPPDEGDDDDDVDEDEEPADPPEDDTPIYGDTAEFDSCQCGSTPDRQASGGLGALLLMVAAFGSGRRRRYGGS